MQKFFGRNLKLVARNTHISKSLVNSFKATSILSNVFDFPYKSSFLTPFPRHYFSTDPENNNKDGNPINNDNTTGGDNAGGTLKNKPQTIPLKPYKAELTVAEQKVKQQSFVLFTAANPVIPYSQQNGVIKTGNLGSAHITHELLYVLQSESNGDIYTVGVVLKGDVNKKLKHDMNANKKGSESDNILVKEDPSSTKTTIATKEKNFRVKITEIEFKDNCIFAKGIPLKDEKLSKEEKLVNIETEVIALRNTYYSIQYLLQIERVEAFSSINFDEYTSKGLDHEKLDELLYGIVSEVGKVNGYLKDNFHEFFQMFLEQTNPITRLFIVKKKLDELFRVVDIISKSMKAAEDSIRKSHDMAKARLSIEYIKNNYLGGAQQNQPGQGGVGMMGGFGANQGAGTNKAKVFMDKLYLIKDEVSRDKIKKEIERFAAMDKYSNEYHKIYTYLDEVFSIPWDKRSDDFWDVDYSQKVLDDELFGLDRVKERIIELIAVNKLRRSQEGSQKKGFIICLYGPPGTGKTSIAKAVSKSLKRESRFISFAGVSDSHFIKGHRRTYVDSQPGVFVRELIRAKTMNPVFVLDEIDKIGRNL